jgi:hypothetical protein
MGDPYCICEGFHILEVPVMAETILCHFRRSSNRHATAIPIVKISRHKLGVFISGYRLTIWSCLELPHEFSGTSVPIESVPMAIWILGAIGIFYSEGQYAILLGPGCLSKVRSETCEVDWSNIFFDLSQQIVYGVRKSCWLSIQNFSTASELLREALPRHRPLFQPQSFLRSHEGLIRCLDLIIEAHGVPS